MKIIDYLQAKRRQYLTKYFANSTWGRELRKFKNIHHGRRCFIIGNGPSLRAEDLEVIAQHNEISFAFNRIYYIFDKTAWRPTYYISQDELMAAKSYDRMCSVESSKRFFPIELKWWYGIPLHDCAFFHLQAPTDIFYPKFSPDISKCVYNSPTVVFSAMQIAAFMGFKEIYLLGVDQHFRTSRNAKGEIVVDLSAKDYFTDAYNKDKDDLPIPSTELSVNTFVSAGQYCDSHGIRIYNATRGGMLEVYPRVEFDSLF